MSDHRTRRLLISDWIHYPLLCALYTIYRIREIWRTTKGRMRDHGRH